MKFIPKTHYFWTGGKDGHLKWWDGDTYQLLMDFEDCVGEIKSICGSSSGDYVVAGGVDGGFRVWKQTNEQIYFAEQQEKRN